MGSNCPSKAAHSKSVIQDQCWPDVVPGGLEGEAGRVTRNYSVLAQTDAAKRLQIGESVLSL